MAKTLWGLSSDQIEGHRRYTDNRLSPNGVANEGIIAQMRREIPYWVIGTLTVAAVFFTYLGYAVVTENYAKHTIEQIASLEKKMSPEHEATTSERTVFQ